jgi:hypothetical protein
MATQPKALAEERANPPGVTDNGALPKEQEHEEEVSEPAQEETEEEAPAEGEPPAKEPEPEPEAAAEEFEPDPQFTAKFKDESGRIDWKKAHDAYLNLEKKMGSQHEKVVPQEDVERLRAEAAWARQVSYLVQKYPNLPVQQAHEREMAEQARLQQPQQAESTEVDELPEEELERRVEELISQGKHAKAQILAARYTPEAKLVRRQQRDAVVERQRREQEVVAKARESNRSALDAIRARDGEIPEPVLEAMRVTLAKTPPEFQVDIEDLYQLAKMKVGKLPKKPAAPQPPGRQPARGSAAPTRGNPKPGTDEEFLRGKRDLTFEEVLEANKKKK